MPFDYGAGLQIAGGLLGLGQSGRDNAEAREAMRNSNSILSQRSKILSRMNALAENYDPEQEDRQSIEYAKQMSSEGLAEGLGILRGRMGMGDSEFRVSERDLAARYFDPLRKEAANLASSRVARRLQALGSVVAAGGDVMRDYQMQSKMLQSDPTGSIMAIAGGIDKLSKKKGKEVVIGSAF